MTVLFFAGTYWLALSDTKLGHILGYASDITIDAVIEQTNRQRAQSGLQQVTYDPVLSDAARRKAADMFAAQYWAHTSPTGKEPWDFMREARYSYSIAGENLARDFMDTSSMVSAWMASPTHKANIMNPRYSEIGVAVVNGTLLGTDTTLVVQMFGDPVSVAAVPQTTNAAPTSPPAVITQPAAVVTQEVVQEPEQVVLEQPSLIVDQNQDQEPQQVLSTIALPVGESAVNPLIAPNNLWKAFGISVALLLITTLIYDALVVHNTKVARIVGRNTAHIALFLVVIFVLLFFKTGVIS